MLACVRKDWAAFEKRDFIHQSNPGISGKLCTSGHCIPLGLLRGLGASASGRLQLPSGWEECSWEQAQVLLGFAELFASHKTFVFS